MLLARAARSRTSHEAAGTVGEIAGRRFERETRKKEKPSKQNEVAAMNSRRAFFGTIASSAALLASAPAPAGAQAAAGPPDEVLAAAQSMKRFDPGLTDEELAKIARDLQDARAAAGSLNSKKTPLRNSEEPVTRFVIREPG